MTPQVISLSAAGSTAWIPVDYKQNPFNIDIAVVLSNTPSLTYKVEYTLDDVFNSSITPTAFSHGSLVGLTANATGTIKSPVRAIRLTVTSWTSGTATMTALQGIVSPALFDTLGDLTTRLNIHTQEHTSLDLGYYKYKRDFQTKKFTVLDDMVSAATNWNNNRTGCTITDDTSIILEKDGLDNALKVTISAAFTRFQRNLASPVTMTGTVNVWIYFDNNPTPGCSFEFWTTTDNANWATKYVRYVWSGNSYLRKGWNCLSMHTAEDTTTTSATITTLGGDTLGAAINGLKIVVNSMATGEVFRVGGVFWGGTARPNVLINLDDGYSSQWTAFNLFRARGIPISLSIITSKVGTSGYLTWDQLDQMYAWGCDILPHSVTHPAGGLDASTLAEATYELSQSRATLLEHGYYRCADIFAWPQNDYVSSVGVDLIALASSLGYNLSRGSLRRDLPTAQGIDNPMRLPSADLGGKTLASVLKLLDAAELYKQTNILYGHKLVGTATVPASGGAAPADTLEWYWSDFIALADSIASRYTAGTLTPITYSDLRAECRY